MCIRICSAPGGAVTDLSLAVPVFEPIFALERVSFSYPGGRPLLKDVSFALRPGESVGLYGPNGSGKTTLFRIITGLARPAEGRVLFHGRPVRDEKGFAALRRKVGLVLQHAEDQLFCPAPPGPEKRSALRKSENMRTRKPFSSIMMRRRISTSCYWTWRCRE